jgi:hypothetical protein
MTLQIRTSRWVNSLVSEPGIIWAKEARKMTKRTRRKNPAAFKRRRPSNQFGAEAPGKMGAAERKEVIDSDHVLPAAREASLVRISRSNAYYSRMLLAKR